MCQYHSNDTLFIPSGLRSQDALVLRCEPIINPATRKDACGCDQMIPSSIDGDLVNESHVMNIQMEGGIRHQVCDACPCCDDKCSNPKCFECFAVPESDSEDEIKVCSRPMSVRNRRNVCKFPQKSYTLCQIRRHNNIDSAWLVAGHDVYDATSYIKMHPGGGRGILRNSGGVKDCTEDMNFHSKKGIRLWKQYKIGVVRPCPSETRSDGFIEAGEQCCIS